MLTNQPTVLIIFSFFINTIFSFYINTLNTIFNKTNRDVYQQAILAGLHFVKSHSFPKKIKLNNFAVEGIINPLHARLFNFYFYRDSQLQVGENCPHLLKLMPNIYIIDTSGENCSHLFVFMLKHAFLAQSVNSSQFSAHSGMKTL